MGLYHCSLCSQSLFIWHPRCSISLHMARAKAQTIRSVQQEVVSPSSPGSTNSKPDCPAAVLPNCSFREMHWISTCHFGLQHARKSSFQRTSLLCLNSRGFEACEASEASEYQISSCASKPQIHRRYGAVPHQGSWKVWRWSQKAMTPVLPINIVFLGGRATPAPNTGSRRQQRESTFLSLFRRNSFKNWERKARHQTTRTPSSRIGTAIWHGETKHQSTDAAQARRLCPNAAVTQPRQYHVNKMVQAVAKRDSTSASHSHSTERHWRSHSHVICKQQVSNQ